jgi:hypothetical protein
VRVPRVARFAQELAMGNRSGFISSCRGAVGGRDARIDWMRDQDARPDTRSGPARICAAE